MSRHFHRKMTLILSERYSKINAPRSCVVLASFVQDISVFIYVLLTNILSNFKLLKYFSLKTFKDLLRDLYLYLTF